MPVPVIREAKPAWSTVPAAVREEAARLAGSPIRRARRTYGGYGPSATFVLTLDDDRRAFFKGVYPLPEGSGVRWSLDSEERVYAELGEFIQPWAPAYYGSLKVSDWHALLLEALDGGQVLPWTLSRAQRASRSYAEFHSSTLGRPLPPWLVHDSHVEFASYWKQISHDPAGAARLAGLAGAEQASAERWLGSNLGALVDAEARLAMAQRPFALLHFDTRSDNMRLQRDLLRMFDWPFACVGPPEFDLAAFAQSIESEGGPSAEQVVGCYASVLPVRSDLVTASAAGLAGYFADRAPRADVPDLPRLRRVQRCQLKTSLAWTARMLGLDHPDWLRG